MKRIVATHDPLQLGLKLYKQDSGPTLTEGRHP